MGEFHVSAQFVTVTDYSGLLAIIYKLYGTRQHCAIFNCAH